MVRCVHHVVPSQVVLEGVGEWLEEAGVAGGGWSVSGCGLRAVVEAEVPAVGAGLRWCAAPRQTQSSGLQGRAVCASRWHTQEGPAVAGGWWYL